MEEFKFFRVLFMSEGKVGHEIIRWIGAAYTVMGTLIYCVELSIKTKLLIY